MSKKNTPKPAQATQRFLGIREIRDDVVVMKDGTLRGVLLVSSLNFALKSLEEQEAIIQAYMTFLNGLEFPIQIVIQSRRMNIDGYLASLSQYEKKSTNELLKAQIADYRNFVGELIELGQIMQKRFYVVIPYHHTERNNDFNLIKEQINLNRDIVLRGLEKLGMKARQLDSLEILDLFYGFYNSSQAKTQELKGQTIQMLLQNNYV